MKTTVALLVLVACAHSANLPPSFKKCNRSSPEPAKCYLEAASDGLPQLTKAYPEVNLPNFEPMEITELRIAAGSQSVVNVEQIFRNCKLFGLSKLHFDELNFDFDEKVLSASGLIPEIDKKCQYEFNGKILLLPMVGTGPSTIVLKNIKFTYRSEFEVVEKKNKHFMKFGSTDLSLDPESVSYNFENLFNGDKQLGDNMNKVLNENHLEVFSDVRKGYEAGLAIVLKQVLSNMFAKVSIEEGFD